MVRINKVITRTGDRGETSLAGGARVPKDSLRIEVCGSLDELNASMGMARTLAEQTLAAVAEQLATVQNQLFDLGAEIATPSNLPVPPQMVISGQDILQLEEWTDNLLCGLPELRSFVLPGGSLINSALHLARTACRRAERRAVQLARAETIRSEVTVFLNRLSDYLFAAARFERHQAGQGEYLWTPSRRSSE